VQKHGLLRQNASGGNVETGTMSQILRDNGGTMSQKNRDQRREEKRRTIKQI
jgi:hypothetical protein